MAVSFEKLKDGYRQKWDSMEIKPSVLPAVDGVARRIIANKKRYQAIEASVGVPWQFIGVLHYRESNLNFNCNLHNGEPLSVRTRLVPRGRGPFASFEESAVDALTMKGKEYQKITDWGIEQQAFRSEMYNGFGYQGRSGGNPYLWGGSNHYRIGKYIRDGVYSGSFYDPQLGVMPILKRIDDLDLTKKEVRRESTTLSLIAKVRAGLSALFAAAVALFSMDTVQIWREVWSTVNEFGRTYWLILLALSLTCSFVLLKWIESKWYGAYKDNNYTPSGLKGESPDADVAP
jgi:lysozyme family protein